MAISKRERNVLLLAGIVAVIFLANSVVPAARSLYETRQGNIETISLELDRERNLIEDTALWRERRVEAEARRQELEQQVFNGDTVPIIEANIQRELSRHARDSGVQVNSTRLAETLQTGDWVAISQEMSFRTTDAANTVAFLEKLDTSLPRLRVTGFTVNRTRSQYSGSITVVGFARADGLDLDSEDDR